MTWHKYLKSFFVEDKDLSILYNQYYGCWWSCDLRRYGISNNGLVKPGLRGPPIYDHLWRHSRTRANSTERLGAFDCSILYKMNFAWDDFKFD